MGEVYLPEDTRLGRGVAMKFSTTVGALERFQCELTHSLFSLR